MKPVHHRLRVRLFIGLEAHAAGAEVDLASFGELGSVTEQVEEHLPHLGEV